MSSQQQQRPPLPLPPNPPPPLLTSVGEWEEEGVRAYLLSRGHSPKHVSLIVDEHKVDGKALLLLNEDDIKLLIGHKPLGDVKRLLHDITALQKPNHRRHNNRRPTIRRQRHHHNRRQDSSHSSSPDTINNDVIITSLSSASPSSSSSDDDVTAAAASSSRFFSFSHPESPITLTANSDDPVSANTAQQIIRRTSTGYATHLRPELFKAVVAMAYLFVVTWITALVMVIVHDRVPDMEKYPPLPDLFLDNMPHIPWAFEMCEVTGTILFTLWLGVLLFHKHRFILIRRFFALSGTVFLLRCVTMLITSLSVPGTHLKCNPRPYGDWMSRLYNAYLIWKGAGMSIQGVRTCGDYMFSGHTVALTMLNFFVTEYTPRRLYFIHTFSWLLNMFGIFFILAAHEHYSIDVFIAFYITSRLFLYYHTLANNQALMQKDSRRTKVWFPLFSYFESGVDGIVPNSYEWPLTPRRIKKLFRAVSCQLERKYKATFFTREHDSRTFGLFRTKTNPFIKPNTKDQ